MIRRKKKEIEWLEFELLADEPGLVHGVFLRHGGVSKGAFGSLNAGGGSGDSVEHVQENRRRIGDALGVQRWIGGKQVHGADVVCATHADEDLGACDGILTSVSQMGLLIKHADCQAAIFYDPLHKALACVHAGWRGNVLNIYRAAVNKMQAIYGSRSENLLVGVSPSLGPKHAEFIHYEKELPREFWRFQVKPQYFDLWAIARNQLEECGILPGHIQIAEICTYANQGDFFSYRRDKTTGRHATMAALK